MDFLNYHQLLNFWLVAREGSVQKASEVLHVTPASVSIQIKQLERALGVQLFRRQGRGLAVTEIGEQVADYASEIFSTGRELVEMVRGRPVGRPLELRVGVRDAMPKLVAFQLLQPAFAMPEKVKVICHEGDMNQLVGDLAIHKLDVILTDTALDPFYKVQAYSHRLGESEVVIVGTPELAQKYQKNFPACLNDAPFLLPTDSNVLRRAMDQWFRDLSLTPMVRGEFADSAMLKIAGRHGMGLFPVAARILDDVTSIYGLQLVGTAAGVTEQFYAVSVERKLRHPAVIAIRDSAA